LSDQISVRKPVGVSSRGFGPVGGPPGPGRGLGGEVVLLPGVRGAGGRSRPGSGILPGWFERGCRRATGGQRDEGGLRWARGGGRRARGWVCEA
jgi:hypothetical protein